MYIWNNWALRVLSSTMPGSADPRDQASTDLSVVTMM
jgi:hypothetical protein